MAGLVDRDTNGLSPEVYQSLTTYEAWDEEASCLRQVVEALNSSLEAIHQAIEVPRYALDEETAKLIPAEAQERELFEMIEALVVRSLCCPLTLFPPSSSLLESHPLLPLYPSPLSLSFFFKECMLVVAIT